MKYEPGWALKNLLHLSHGKKKELGGKYNKTISELEREAIGILCCGKERKSLEVWVGMIAKVKKDRECGSY